MNELIKEWVDKAEGDFLTASREFQANCPNYDAVCFHAQQCIEKHIKAALISHHQTPPKSHDLVELSRLLHSSCAGWDWPIEELRLLTRAAVIYRYPGESAENEEAEASLNICRALRQSLRKLLSIE